MCNISVGRYPVPTDEQRAELEESNPGCQWPADRYQGWISPDECNWTAFVGVDGDLSLVVDGEMVFDKLAA